jgi:hypothetical protein
VKIALARLALLAILTTASAPPLPHPKGAGQCSGGYIQSGSFCVPKSDRSPPAVPKVGQCSSGWRQSGSTCEKMGR